MIQCKTRKGTLKILKNTKTDDHGLVKISLSLFNVSMVVRE